MSSKKSLQTVASYLPNIENMRKARGSQKTGLVLSLNTSSSTGQGLALKGRDGTSHGRSGALTLPNGMEIKAAIQTERGANLLPSLTSQQTSSLSAVVYKHESMTQPSMTGPKSDPDDYKLPKIPPNDLEMWGKTYIQGMAALEPSPEAPVIVLIGALKIKRPTVKMGEKDTRIFLNMTVKLLIEAGYGYFAIEQGIKELMTKHEDPFFPSDQVLRKYIYPINYRQQHKMNLLGVMLEQS